MTHVVVVGAGRVGGQVAFTLVFERYVSQLSLVDTVPKLAEMTKEELHHAIASHGFDMEIDAFENSKSVKNADLIVVAAGFPRTPQMSRRDLATKNAAAVRQIVDNTLDNNPSAWYFVITNPVDAMTTLAYNTAKNKTQMIGTGTNLETSRFRTILARQLKVPLSDVEAYVGGEHGEAAVLLWSTVRIDGLKLDDYLKKTGKKLDKTICDNYVKEVSRQIITHLGGTRYGPAGSFIEIIRGILLNTGKMVSYSRLMKFETTPQAVHVTVPARISKSLGPDIWSFLDKSEQEAIKQAAGTIYKTYCEAEGER